LTFWRERSDDSADVPVGSVLAFVEHFGANPGETDELLALWPPPLRAAPHRIAV
jgi:hypothetical protein